MKKKAEDTEQQKGTGGGCGSCRHLHRTEDDDDDDDHDDGGGERRRIMCFVEANQEEN